MWVSKMDRIDDFSHLTHIASVRGQLDFKLRQMIVSAIRYVPGLWFLVRLVNRLLSKFCSVEQAARQTRDLELAAIKAENDRSPLQSFADKFVNPHGIAEVPCAQHLREELLLGDWQDQKTESGDVYEAIIPLVASLVEQKKLKHVLNYGVCYAHIDSELARRFPEVEFTAVGRSPLTKPYNEQFFKLANLHFESSDIADLLPSRSWPDSVLLHTRTISSMLPAYVARFYRQLYESGLGHVVLAEPCGISWQTGKPYVFSAMMQPSVAMRNFMYIHNYPGLLMAAGYRIDHSRLIQTRHPDPNFRILIMAASRI